MFKKASEPFGSGISIFQMIWLVYMAAPIYSMLQKPVPEMWIGFPLLILFVALNIASYRDVPRRLLYVLLMYGIVVYLCFRYDITFWFMGFYAAPIIGLLPSRKQFYSGMAVMLLLFVFVFGSHTHHFTGSDLVLMIPSSALMIGLPFILRAGVRSRELKAKLHSANEEIARLVQIEERQRISRDLHDTLGHTLSLITLKSELAEKLVLKQPERAVQEVRDIQMTARAALKQVRELVSGMNAVTLTEEIQHAGRILAAANMELTVEGDASQLKASPVIQNILGMCLREAVTNVVKHSKATCCGIVVQEDRSEITVTVRDNGVGLQEAAVAASPSGHGLVGMKERLDLIDGRLELQSEPGKGTQVTLSVPNIVKNQQAGDNKR
ncbi:sensor histidine kinase [Paenibacillus sp. H1-7]|uniref:sensor histidine kinase n=1 Tax=Paenibacillus sp. H1-7 TaxID=2282849 RepID=UPI001EF97B50|nr:sensor histidine kinase [Paenibacillus sp. H1-7]ULL13694.1 sensor histidine kinase [Paenibacillus sp. H1-7]